MAARLRKLGIDFLLLEKTDAVGFSWQHHYDRLHLHTVKQFSHLPYLPFPEDYPLYVSRAQMCDYFESYARTFDLKPRFGEEVTEISRAGDRWRVSTQKGNLFHAREVVIGTGVNRIPYSPEFEGEAEFKGTIVHSRAYRRVDPFQGQSVLVVGMGNTGAEIALDFAEHDIPVAISVRGPINIVPRDAFGRPTQVTAKNLDKLPNWLSDRLGKIVQMLTVGNLAKYGLKTPSIAPAKQLREHGKTPVIDLGTVDMIKAGKIKILPAIERIEANGVRLEDGGFYECQAIIISTGYRPMLGGMIERVEELLDANECPKEVIPSGFHEGLYFLGFDNYTPGGILGVIHRDSELIARSISSRVPQPA